MLCNPNNPTGTRLPAARVLDLAAAPETLVVVDESGEVLRVTALSLQLTLSPSPICSCRGPWQNGGSCRPEGWVCPGSSQCGGPGLRVTGPYDVNSLAVTAAMVDQSYTDTLRRKSIACA